MELFIVYWIITTLVGTVWLIMSYAEKEEYVSLADIIGSLLISAIIAWAFIIIWLLDVAKIKIKRNVRTKEK